MEKHLFPVGVGRAVRDAAAVLGPLRGGVDRYRCALAGQLHGGGEKLLQGQVPEAAVQLRPAPHGSGDGDGKPALGGHFPKPPVPDQLGRQGGGSGTAGVEAVEFLVLRDPDQGEAVRAKAVPGRLQQGHSRGHGHRRVHRVAAPAHDLQANLRPLGNGGAGCRPAGIDRVPAGGVDVFLRVELHHLSTSQIGLGRPRPDTQSVHGGFLERSVRKIPIVPAGGVGHHGH